ncbi:GNAT family N-acetyltransferase [Peribacillus sp. SCS-26]|uniref:GNAT family N-acetyltransferase n=1 Tax=Paraperibacillus marinus TaxID=3115295 RepID=UPI003906718D
MDSLKEVVEMDLSYLEAFSTRTDREWGSLFCNEEQPQYYDANHAHISGPVQDGQAVIEEVKEFYRSRGIIPRFYLYNLELQQEFIAQLRAEGFGFEELASPVQVWTGGLTDAGALSGEISIEEVTRDNYEEALEIECSIHEFGGRTVREKAFEQEFHSPHFVHYLLRNKGKACATACLFLSGKNARMESVATLEEYRGRGLIGYVIRHIQAETLKRNLRNLWVFPINEKIGKVYRKYGFKTVENLTTGHAYLGGRSITDIRENV